MNFETRILTRESPAVVTHDKRLSIQDLSADQVAAYDAVVAMARTQKLTKLGGYAGTGKSTLIPFVAQTLGGNTAFCSFTGKASNVLHRKLRAAQLLPDFCGTIHSLIYSPILSGTGQCLGWKRRSELEYDRIIIDESSMVGETLLYDLMSYGIPIIAVGDPGQLPPIKDTSIIDNPDFLLEQIHRQAEGSAIIQLANRVRKEGDLPKNKVDSKEVVYLPRKNLFPTIGASVERLGLEFGILVRRNVVRRTFNVKPRTSLAPIPGDVVICLKNSPPVFNGMRGILEKIQAVKDHWYDATIYFPDDGLRIQAPICRHQFGRENTITDPTEVGMASRAPLGLLFDFGLAMTVHKAQGSAFKEAVLLPERWKSDNADDYCKWLYTAVTRASEKLYISE